MMSLKIYDKKKGFIFGEECELGMEPQSAKWSLISVIFEQVLE